ncbi:MAG: gene transfer agent family protein [Pseudomonadota bacterium]
MANPWTGEVSVRIDGVPHVCKLTLGALVGLEEALGERSLVELAERFESGAFSSRDVMAVIVAGLRGGGWRGMSSDLMTVEIEGGPVGAAKVAALLLTRAFSVPA